MNRPFAILLLCSLVQAPASFADEESDLLEVALASGQFNTLCLAIQAAGLTDTLRSEGPFTVFAPTDEAFAGLDLSDILGDRDALREILTYHVVPGLLLAREVRDRSTLGSAQGQPLFVRAGTASTRINGANILAADLSASNGVIHVIDRVLAPMDLIDSAVAAGGFDTLTKAVRVAGLSEALRGEGPFTVFAPTDEAFSKLPEGVLQGLLSDPAKLAQVLRYHVVAGRILAADVASRASAPTLLGEALVIDTSEGVRVGGARVIAADLQATNGVIHVIDRVLVPDFEALEKKSSWSAPTEADLPAGFPTPTPPGEIQVKSYPAIRGAFVQYDGWLAFGTWATFWTLFRHIQSEKIEMTAPVYADYPERIERRRGRMRVGFLYPDDQTGRTGRRGGVEVSDLDSKTTVALGVRGSYDMESMRKGVRRLEAWLEENREEWRADGSPRRLMYQQPKWENRGRLYSEIEIPIVRVIPDPNHE